MRQLISILSALTVLLISSCGDDSVEGKVESIMGDYVQSINDNNVDDMLKLVYPPLFDSIPKRDVAHMFDHMYSFKGRKLKIRALNKIYGPYESNGTQYLLGDFKIQKGTLIFKRQNSIPFIFASDDGDKWYIIPYGLDYSFGRSNLMGFTGYRLFYNTDYQLSDIVPIGVLKKMYEEYIPGSEK